MRRWLFNLAAVVSLVLCLGTVVLWVRSRQTTVVLAHRQWKQARWQAVLSRGRMGVNNQPQLDSEMNRRYSLSAQLRDAEIRGIIALKTLEHRHIQLLMEYNNDLPRVKEVEQSDTETHRSADEVVTAIGNVARITSAIKALATPPVRYETSLALPTALFAILPVVWIWRCYARWNAVARGMCVACGYNLTGNTSGVCPECGTAIAPAGARITRAGTRAES